LAYPLDEPIESLGEIDQWQVEWKWDGIRVQIVKRGGRAFIWTRGEELVTEAFPETAEAVLTLVDGTVLDGELIARRDGRPMPFAALQKRIGRKRVSKRLQADIPVALIAYDLLESNGRDIRHHQLTRRRDILDAQLSTLSNDAVTASPQVRADSWSDLSRLHTESRRRGVEGFMLKRRDSIYDVGRKRGNWWKWKVAPLTADAVLIYAQRGHGRRSGLYTDYTFAVWDNDTLVPFAKAYSGLSDREIREVDRFIQSHTVERYGPVRAVTPQLVFEIAFEGIQPSKRHKSGVAVRFPRIARWRKDKGIEDADTLVTLKALLNLSGQ
jgi:DNA ligase-1